MKNGETKEMRIRALERTDLKNIHIIDNNSAIVPKSIKHHLFDKLSDYPYIKYHNLMTYQKP